MVKPCWRHGPRRGGGKGREGVGKRDGLMWYKELGNHAYGEYSMAVIQANQLLEDQCQLESGALSFTDSGPYGTFVGVYDGHGGPETSRFVNENLFNNIKRLATEKQQMSANVIKTAFLATENIFLSEVRKQWHCTPQLASVGSCCLAGVISNGLMYIANAGDSRAVLGRSDGALRCTEAIQLSTEHNARYESVRQELRSSHPHDPQIVVLKHNVWRVKGVIQVSRSVGDAYLKRPELNRAEPFLKAEPTISVHKLHPDDQFLIFASDGLWEHLSNQEAVDIVQHYPRHGMAKRLVKAALREAAKKREMRYSDMKKIDRGVRRHFHDDVTVIVVYLDRAVIDSNAPVSVKCGLGVGSA